MEGAEKLCSGLKICQSMLADQLYSSLFSLTVKNGEDSRNQSRETRLDRLQNEKEEP